MVGRIFSVGSGIDIGDLYASWAPGVKKVLRGREWAYEEPKKPNSRYHRVQIPCAPE